ncbi:MAG: hypothetical protein M9947_00540 [Thermomicrobiales bacterium]|nr:hypothetical protein [Thermomicrobiales bacterium]
MVSIDGLDDPVGPGSTIGFAAVANAIKSQTAEALVALGTPPLVLSSSVVIGDASAQRFDLIATMSNPAGYLASTTGRVPETAWGDVATTIP